MSDHLSPALRTLVRQTVAALGDVIREELGAETFARVERVRARMARLRGRSRARVIAELQGVMRTMEKLPRRERRDFARAYALMLELMNACENAYRSHRIGSRRLRLPRGRPDSIIYVLTAHPTEARSPQNTWVFGQIHDLLVAVLAKSEERADWNLEPGDREALIHWLEVAWRAPAMRSRKPRVEDEAEHVYSTLLQDDILSSLLKAGRELAPIYVRSWVGGDKDGHPGVDERTFVNSLSLSRRLIVRYVIARLDAIKTAGRAMSRPAILRAEARVRRQLPPLQPVSRGDGARTLAARAAILELIAVYEREVRAPHPAIQELRQLLRMFPALVVPLELRESSDVLQSSPSGRGLAIFRMLEALAALSGRADPRWYVRGFIISMAGSLAHVRLAAGMTKRALGGGLRIPIIPLFEQRAALESAAKIVGDMLGDRELRRAISSHWGGYLEVMLGYSDSSKEMGVLQSRLDIARAMHSVDRLCAKHRGVTPLFFQGSGGSVDRGGGTIGEQTAWWSPGALRNYKVTLQGEMVERSLASPEIARGQLERIVQSAGARRNARAYRQDPAVARFAARVAEFYGRKIREPEFLQVVEHATPYLALDQLKIGSRPTRRTTQLSVAGLRAIPWVLCWTQTRVLFPTWWGIGAAWRAARPGERAALARAYRRDPVFTTFMRALGFTLAKVELPVWRLYLEHSGLPAPVIERTWANTLAEFDATQEFARRILGKHLVGWRPWLEESIALRSPMIHPLNLLQILALNERDAELLRLTLLGAASGMMTTG